MYKLSSRYLPTQQAPNEETLKHYTYYFFVSTSQNILSKLNRIKTVQKKKLCILIFIMIFLRNFVFWRKSFRQTTKKLTSRGNMDRKRGKVSSGDLHNMAINIKQN